MAGENDNNTILAEKCSQDGGHTWQNYRRISKIDEGFGRSHGVYFSYEEKLYAFCPKASFNFNTYVNLKTEAYVMNDKGEYECLGVILDDSFWPLCEPIVLDDGSLIMAGINAAGWPPKGYGLPAVALCDGKDITMWEVKNLPDPNSICFWGETAVLKQREKLIAIVRNNGRKCALTSESSDGGKTWSNLVESNLPILDSKVYAGMLSNGKQYIVFNMQERGYRETLVIAVGTDTFDKVYIIRDGFDAPPKFWQNNEWCYPYAYEDIDNNKLLRDVFLAVFCNVLFGSAVPMIKLGYTQFSIIDDVFAKILFAGIRFFLSGIIVFVVDAFIQRKMPTINKQNRICIVTVALTYTFLQYLFNYIGLSNTTGARGSVLTSTSAFISVIFAHICYRNDRMNFSKIIGSIIGFTGVVLVCSANDGFKKITLFGEGFVIISATCFVIGSMINKKATQLNSSFTVTAFNLLIGGGLLAIIGIIGYKGDITLSMGGIFVLLYLIMVSSIGFTLWSSLLRKYPIGKLGVFNFIIPVSGAILSGIVLGENVFNLQYIFSFVLISVGIISVNSGFGRNALAIYRKD